MRPSGGRGRPARAIHRVCPAGRRALAGVAGALQHWRPEPDHGGVPRPTGPSQPGPARAPLAGTLRRGIKVAAGPADVLRERPPVLCRLPRPPPSGTGGWLRRAAARLLGSPGAPRPGALPDGPHELLAAALDALPDPVLLVDDAGHIHAAGRAVGDVLGRAPAALRGAPLAEALVAARDRAGYRARLNTLAPGTPAPPGADAGAPPLLAVVCGDGSEVLADVTVRPVTGSGLFAVTVRPAPAAAPASGDAEGRRRTLRAIVDTLPDPVVAVDRAGRVVFQNQAAVRGAGAASPDGAARVASDAWQREAAEVMRAGAPVVDREAPGADGAAWLASRVPVRDAAGAVVGLVAISRNVTAQRAAEAQLRADKRAAEAAARANREFLATTSHEVRTLMSGVTGMTTLLLGTALDGEQREFVDTIRSSSRALLTVINDVLDFSKIEAGMLALDDRPFSVRATVEEAARMIGQQAAAKGLDLTWDVAPDVPETARGDADRVRQVLLNLLSNAVKFTSQGSVRVRVERAPAAGDGGALAFTVEDTGVGIAPDRLDAVFDQFEQADASTARTHGGTGLGLAICRRLVEMMGGEMSVESVPDEGSAFRFTVAGPGGPAADGPLALSVSGDGVPAEPEPPPSEPPPAEPPPAEPPPSGPETAAPTPPDPEPPDLEPPLPVAPADASVDGLADRPAAGVVMSTDAIIPGARVLLAEDNPVNQRVAMLTLRRLGYRPDVVPDGAKAVFAVRNRPYDVVLMDVMMPVMDGLEATRRIRADPGQHPAPAIVALTANALDGDRQRCLDAGCDDYLAKPVAPEVLAATIEKAVRDQAARQPTDA